MTDHDGESVLSDELSVAEIDTIADTVVADLVFRDGDARSSLSLAIKVIVADYLAARGAQAATPYDPVKTKTKREELSKLRGAVDTALSSLDQLSPEWRSTMEEIAQSEMTAKPHHNANDWRNGMLALRDAVDVFGDHFQPPRHRYPDYALHNAVLAYIFAVEESTGGKVVVSLNKNKPGGPSLNSPEARALGTLLNSIDLSVSTTSIVNMVRKVRKKPVFAETPASIMFEANPFAVLDASVLPGRKAAQQWSSFLDT